MVLFPGAAESYQIFFILRSISAAPLATLNPVHPEDYRFTLLALPPACERLQIRAISYS